MLESAVRTIASRLIATASFVDVAMAACELAREIFAFAETAVCLHAADGRPVVLVDDTSTWPDVERTYWLETGWRSDSHLQRVREHHAPSGDEHVLLSPLLQTGALLGTVRYASSWRLPAELRRDLETLANHISVRLAELGVTTDAGAPAPQLTARQREIAELAARGNTNSEISQLLELSENTVKKHLKDVFARLGVDNRTELVHVLSARNPLGDMPEGITRRHGITITRRSR